MQLNGDCSDEQSLALYKLLPEERKESYERARNQDVAKKRLYTGAFLQYVLSAETGIPMEQLQYEYNASGKPSLVNCDLHFNLSHSGDWVILAVSDAAVGVDVEHKTRNYEGIAKRCFCLEEYECIMACKSEKEQREQFLFYWTMKEAYVKMAGDGMSIPFSSFVVERCDKEVSMISSHDVYGSTFYMDEYCISVCGGSQDDVNKIVSRENANTRCRLELTDIVTLCKI